MKYYTNVQMVGNDFLVRGFENGKSFTSREKFSPALYVPSKKKTKFKTLEGEYVEEIKPGTVRDCREFVKAHAEVENFPIYGNQRMRAKEPISRGFWNQSTLAVRYFTDTGISCL